MKLAERILEKAVEAQKTDEAVNVKNIIKELIDTSFGGSNEDQMKAVQLLKGLATSDEPEANKFMNKLDKFTSSLKVDENIQDPSKMIKEMIMAVEKQDENMLLKFMAMDKKGMFGKKYLDSEVADGKMTKDEASKLGKMSIGVAMALDSINMSNPADKKKKMEMAMMRVKEVK